MIKAKKLLSILCSAAMVVSVFASTIVNAASGATDEVALGMNYKLVSETDLVKVFEIYATGFGTIEGWKTGVDFNGEVDKIESVTSSINAAAFGSDLTEGWFKNGDAMTKTGVWAAADGVKSNGNILLNTITVTLKQPLTQPLKISTYEEAEVSDPDMIKKLGYTPWYSDGDWQANTLTFDVLKSEPDKAEVTPVAVKNGDSDVFTAPKQDGTNAAVAAVFDGTTTKAASKLTWKIDATPVDSSKTPKKTTFEYDLAGEINAGATIKVGLVVAYDDAEFSNVTITSLEY